MTVYIVQNPTYKDPDTGQVHKRFDLSNAADFGELKTLLHPFRLPDDYEEIERQLHEQLADFVEGDYILPLGDMTSCCMAAVIAAQKTDGLVDFLKWDKRTKTYYPVSIEV